MSGPSWSDLDSEEYCYLTTTGRVTGNPHTIEIWFVAVRNTAYLLAGSGEDADWVRNLRANSAVAFRIADDDYSARARPVTDPGEDRGARRLLYEKYNPDYSGDLENWRDTALLIAVDRSEQT